MNIEELKVNYIYILTRVTIYNIYPQYYLYWVENAVQKSSLKVTIRNINNLNNINNYVCKKCKIIYHNQILII